METNRVGWRHSYSKKRPSWGNNRTKEGRGINMDLYEKAWSGKHGEEYAKKCVIDPESRAPIFKKLIDIMKNYDGESVISASLELGCNAGHNLEAIKLASNGDITDIKGLEIRKDHCTKPSIINGSIYDIPWEEGTFSLTFTSGVLIHIPPDRVVEAEEEKGTKYREDFEYKDGVWARPFGEIYKRSFPQDTLIETGKVSDLGDEGWGFPKCNYWIYNKL